MSYLSLRGETVTKKTMEKSKFITTSRHVASEEEAKSFIAEISAKFSDATHNCYAYICDNLGNFLRFSDDNEPQGTAGMPMLEVLKSNKLYESAVVVTRYFGGIKLGAGGLVRAYSGCAAENIAAAEKALYALCAESRYIVDYSMAETAQRYFALTGVNIISCEYLDEVAFTAAVKRESEEKFNAELSDRLCGRVRIEKIREYFFPFSVK